MKVKGESSFEPLEPMKFFNLEDQDSIRFGEIITVFHQSEDEVESSQVSTYYSLDSKEASKFFVPGTEKIVTDDVSFNSDSIEIPQTQDPENYLKVPTPCKRIRIDSTGSASSGTVLEIISNVDEKSRDGFENGIPGYMESQDIFGEVTINKTNVLLDDDDDDELMEEIAKIEQKNKNIISREGSATPDLDFPMDRDGSATPELDCSTKPHPKTQFQLMQADIETQINFEDEPDQLIQANIATQINHDFIMLPPQSIICKPLLQADIATQINPDLDDQGSDSDDTQDLDECDNHMLEPTQPMFMFGAQTRLNSKRQAKLKPKTVSLTEFDDTQLFELPSPAKRMKPCFDMETQPIDVNIPKNVNFQRKPKVVNRILVSSDESDGESSRKYPAMDIKIFKTSPATPAQQQRSIMPSESTPDFVPDLPTHSQVGSFLEMINASQPPNETAVAFDSNAEDRNKSSTKTFKDETKLNKVRRRIMKFDDEKIPSDKKKENKSNENSKPGRKGAEKSPRITRKVLRRNSTKTLTKSTENFSKPTEKSLNMLKLQSKSTESLYNSTKSDTSTSAKKLRQTLLKIPEKSVKIDEKLTKNLEELTKFPEKSPNIPEKPPIILKKSSRIVEKLPKIPEKSSENPKKSTEIQEISTKIPEKSPKIPETVPKVTRKSLKMSQLFEKSAPLDSPKTYAIAFTNMCDVTLTQKLEATCKILGSTFVNHVKDADLLLTDNKLKLTAKCLASICKGIPIVGREFIESSKKAKVWLNPFDFIVVDEQMETKKNICLKTLILKAKSQKFLQNYSVFVTKNTSIPINDLREIIESAGAECIQNIRDPAKHKNVLLIYNSKETGQIRTIAKKFPNITQVRDSQVSQVILRQEL